MTYLYFCSSSACLVRTAEDQAKLVLAGRHLVVVLVDLHAHPLHRGQHFGAQVHPGIDRVDREIAALDARAVAHVAHLVFGVGVPRAASRVDLVGHLVHRHLRSGRRRTGRTRPRGRNRTHRRCRRTSDRPRPFRGAARVAVIGLAGVGLDHRAVQTHRLFRKERVHIGEAASGISFMSEASMPSSPRSTSRRT
jgi:hypothetical protein